MEIAFADKALRDLCETQLKAERSFGVGVARQLRARLADLRDAQSVEDLVAGSPRVLDAEQGVMAMDLGESLSISFVCNHSNIPCKDDGKVDWSRVRRIKILKIGDSK